MPAADIRARFGARLRSLRERRGLTQVELADYLGLRRTYISDLERGKRNVSLLTLEIIARGFGMSVSQLFRKL
jgi:transcriptional regulator with XRE-family HTH domain